MTPAKRGPARKQEKPDRKTTSPPEALSPETPDPEDPDATVEAEHEQPNDATMGDEVPEAPQPGKVVLACRNCDRNVTALVGEHPGLCPRCGSSVGFDTIGEEVRG